MLDARLEPFSTSGETLHAGIRDQGQFPNHCHVNYPETTHRVRTLWGGGVTLDGNRPITPDRTDLFNLTDAAGAVLSASSVLGLADLGDSAAPSTKAGRDQMKQDGDNYLDVCLKSSGPAMRLRRPSVEVRCDTPDRQMSMPKGLKKAANGLAPRQAPLCQQHSVQISKSDERTSAT
jgi:hypothetical protein